MITFVTGGTSSIGRVLIKDLAKKGERLRVLVRRTSNREGIELPGVEFVYGGVTDAESVRAGMDGCKQVTHMAALVGDNHSEAEWRRVNCGGTKNVLQAAADLGVSSFVQVSSMSVLGHTQTGEIADETRPIDRRLHVNFYQKTKFEADETAREYAARGLPVKIVYPGFGFGCSFASSHPSMQDQTLLRMAAGKPVTVMGSGRNKLFLAYYNDTVVAIDLAHRKGKTGEGYILGNANLTFSEIWEVVAKILGKAPPRGRVPLSLLKTVSFIGEKLRGKPLFPQDFFDMVELDWCFSNQKAVRELGWQPLGFEEAISRTWAAYQEQGWVIK